MSEKCRMCNDDSAIYNDFRDHLGCNHCGFEWPVWMHKMLTTREAQLVEMCEAVDAMAYGQDGKRLTVKKCIRWAKKARAILKELER